VEICDDLGKDYMELKWRRKSKVNKFVSIQTLVVLTKEFSCFVFLLWRQKMRGNLCDFVAIT